MFVSLKSVGGRSSRLDVIKLFVLELELDLVEGVDGRIGIEAFHLVAFALAADDLEPTLARCLEFRI